MNFEIDWATWIRSDPHGKTVAIASRCSKEYNKNDPTNIYRPWGFQPGHQQLSEMGKDRRV